MTILGTSGDDTLTGTPGTDTFNVSQGGNDTVSGLDGNDVINFGASFTAADTVNGGTGSDTVILNGDYSAQLNLGATTLTGVEVIKLTAGNSYDLAMNDANVAAGQTLAINGSLLGAGDTLIFGGGAETNGFFRVEGGAGGDTISMGAELKSKDSIDGGAGNDTLFVGGGDYSLAFAAATIHNIDDFVMFGGHDYHFVTNDTSVSAGATMQVDAEGAETGDTVIFNGVHETDGNFNFIGGAGEMELTGGAGDDTFFMGSHLTAAGRINGGGGSDVVFLGGANYTLSMQKPTLQNVENLKLGAGFNYNLTLGGGIATNVTMTVDATAVGLGNSLAFNALKETAGSVNVFLGAGAANIAGGQQGDAFDASPSGQATFVATDRINGEDGYDRLYLDGDYTGAHALAFTNTTMVNVEELDLNAGHSYDIKIAANTVDDSGLKVDASQLGAGDHLAFNGAAASGLDFLNVLGGAGDDTIAGGADNDIIDVSQGGNDTVTGGSGSTAFVFGATLTAADRVDGGVDGGLAGSNDHISLDGDYTGANALICSPTTFVRIDAFEFAAGHSYDITTNDANVASGQKMTVDGSHLLAGDHLSFNGSAETDGQFTFISGADTDEFWGGPGFDTFVYSKSMPLSGATRDIVHGFDASIDQIQFSTVDTENTPVNGGSVNAATIDANIATLITAARLAEFSFVVLTPKSGNLQGHVFLIVDGNGVAGYQAGSDLVIELKDPLNLDELSPNNFTT